MSGRDQVDGFALFHTIRFRFSSKWAWWHPEMAEWARQKTVINILKERSLAARLPNPTHGLDTLKFATSKRMWKNKGLAFFTSRGRELSPITVYLLLPPLLQKSWRVRKQIFLHRNLSSFFWLPNFLFLKLWFSVEMVMNDNLFWCNFDPNRVWRAPTPKTTPDISVNDENREVGKPGGWPLKMWKTKGLRTTQCDFLFVFWNLFSE